MTTYIKSTDTFDSMRVRPLRAAGQPDCIMTQGIVWLSDGCYVLRRDHVVKIGALKALTDKAPPEDLKYARDLDNAANTVMQVAAHATMAMYLQSQDVYESATLKKTKGVIRDERRIVNLGNAGDSQIVQVDADKLKALVSALAPRKWTITQTPNKSTTPIVIWVDGKPVGALMPCVDNPMGSSKQHKKDMKDVGAWVS